MCARRHSSSSRTSTICTDPFPRERSHSSWTSTRSTCATSRPSARHAVMPPWRKPPRLRMPTAVAAGEHDLLVEVGHPGELRAEAGAERGDRDCARYVRLVELEVGAHVDDECAGSALLLDLARREREDLDARGNERPAVDVDDRLEVRRLWRERGG